MTALDHALKTLDEVVEEHKIAGMSVAVALGGELRTAVAGKRRVGDESSAVTPSTLFQAASVSKPVAAATALRLAADGALDLDADVNDLLSSWTVPAVHGWTPRLTTRHLVTHTAGLTVHGFPGYALSDEVPTTVGVLRGEGNTPAVESFLVPGLQSVYSGGGFTVLQQLLADVTGESFEALAARLVLEPAGMATATYEQPLPESRADEAATGHTVAGEAVEGGWHVYPEQAAAGLWCTPTDLVLFGLAVSDGSLLGEDMTHEMLREQVEGWGLGVMLSGLDPSRRFRHNGRNHGFLSSFETAVGEPVSVAIMTNSESGSAAIQSVVTRLDEALGWKREPPPAGSDVVS